MSDPNPENPFADVRVYQISPEEQARRDQRVRELSEHRREQRAIALWLASGVPARCQAARIEDTSRLPADVSEKYRIVVDRVRKLLDRPAMLALLGSRGAGKTWLSCGLIRESCLRLVSARYLRLVDYLMKLKSTYDGHGDERTIEDEYSRVGLLVIDEMQERGGTGWEALMLTRLLDRRYAGLKATILIGNLMPEDFIQQIGSSAADRLRDDGGGVVLCNWPSLRGRIGDDEASRASDRAPPSQ